MSLKDRIELLEADLKADPPAFIMSRGQGQTASSSTLNTSLTATVTQVLANGYLVVQAAHWVEMDNQRVQIIWVWLLLDDGAAAVWKLVAPSLERLSCTWRPWLRSLN